MTTLSDTTTELKINPEYESMVPVVDNASFERLVQDIHSSGQYYKIVVNQDNVILDGHHRYRACKQLGIEPQYEVRHFSNKLDEKEFVIKSNVKRRQLNDAQLASLAIKLKEIYAEKARLKQLSTLKKGDKMPTPIPSTEGIGKGEQDRHDNESSAQAAKEVGLSRTKFEKAQSILLNGTDELKQKFLKAEVSTDYAYKSVKRSQDHKHIEPLPAKQFSIILADPPWNYDINTRGSPDEHYPVMTQQQIELLPVPSADNAILFLWATNPKLKQALDVMAAWGFKYKTNMVWVKDKIGTGYYVRGKHELLLIGEKGDMPLPEENTRPASVIIAPRGEHSEKPQEVYKLIEQMYPNRQPYLELFARHSNNGAATNQQPYWELWGNEIN